MTALVSGCTFETAAGICMFQAQKWQRDQVAECWILESGSGKHVKWFK